MKRFLFSVLTIFLLIFSSCTKPSPTSEGILSIALNGSPTNIDPRYATDAYSHQVIELCYNGLLKKDADGRPVPDLAADVTIASKVRYEVRLKEGVFFHDGSELTSDDVIYTLSFLKDPNMGSPYLETFSNIDKMEKAGKYGLTIFLKEPFAPFFTALTVPIVKSGTDKGALKNTENGTGPFTMISYSPDESGEFVPFGSYFEGPARVKMIRIKIIPDDNVRFLELKKGEINFVINGVDPDLLEEVRKDERLTIDEATGSNFSYLGFNLHDPILKNRKVREAIAHGINKKEIIDNILLGQAEEDNTLISPLYWAHEKNVRTYEYDPERSKKLLDEAGYKEPAGGDEPRFTLTYKTSQNELRRRIAQVLQGQLRIIGIQVRIQSFEWGTFFSDIKSGNFQMYSLTWVGITDPDIYYYAFHSNSTPPRGANRNRYANPSLDGLLEEGRVETDLEKRKVIYGKIQRIISEDIPVLGLWFNKNILVRDKRVQGFVLRPDESFRPLKDAWIKS
jgi:peptide/nickel transport system substrate-binding protein